jgi:hypothetical protein
MSSVGQEMRVSMSIFTPLAVQFGDGLGLSARRSNGEERTGILRCEHDDTVLAPCSAARFGRLRNGQHGTSGGLDFFHFPIGEEPDLATVGGPE